ncbi:MAG: nitronate monooxygenase [Flavobacteriia bacterium]|nr:nitronate monooxygenase [Flavobacteriia bacterium]
MWNRTKVSELLGIRYPIIQGPFGGRFSSAKLLASVSNAGGLGSFGLNSYQPEEILEINRQIKAATDKPYNLNLWIPLEESHQTDYSGENFEKWKSEFGKLYKKLDLPLPEMPRTKRPINNEQIEALIQAAPPVASFIFGIPNESVIRELQKVGTKVIVAATNLEEAIAIEESKADIILATGREAGGHRPSFKRRASDSLLSTEELAKEVLSNVSKPVVVAGGITDGYKANQFLKLGVSGVQIGTAFLACDESNASEHHKELLRSESSYTTQLTNIFSGRLARTMSSKLVSDFDSVKSDAIAPYPLQSQLLAPAMKELKARGMFEYTAHWAGIPSSLIVERNAESLLRSLVTQIESDQF